MWTAGILLSVGALANIPIITAARDRGPVRALLPVVRVPRGEAPLRRVVVIGAGFFGGVIARRLAEVGITPVVASRTSGELRLDVEDRDVDRAARCRRAM